MSDFERLQQRVLQLEELFSHHQLQVEQLNDVILELRGAVEKLETQVTIQQRRLEALQAREANPESDDPADHKPPHY